MQLVEIGDSFVNPEHVIGLKAEYSGILARVTVTCSGEFEAVEYAASDDVSLDDFAMEICKRLTD